MRAESPKSFFVVDDDPDIVSLVTHILEASDHFVMSSTSSVDALTQIENMKPDIVLIDIMMPVMDGFQLCKRIKDHDDLAGICVLMLSAKAYDFDKSYARKMGANGFITKPFDPSKLVDRIMDMVAGEMTLTYWGVRGTLPVTGQRSLRYGGNTSCVSIEAHNKPLLVFDAGTGIKELGDYLFATEQKRVTAKVFISHPHWDHINALPFFGPMYVPGNEFEVLGARHGDTTMRELISAQMDGVYFPITLREFGARVYFRDLGEGIIDVDGYTVRTMLLSHPGNCLGYRVEWSGRVICYVTDNELFLPGHEMHNPEYEERLVKFCQGADLLITDATYTDAEYASKVTWGHSCISQVAKLAHRAGVKTLHLFHHDPNQDDSAIDGKLADAQAVLQELGSSVVCEAPAEGRQVKF